MIISLEKVAPTYLEAEKISRSGIWNQTIQFKPGERIQVVAPSGSGKTSFVHFIYGMRRDYTGAIKFNDVNLRSIDVNQLAAYRAKEISVVFQDLRLFPDQSVFENIEIKRRLNPFHDQSRIKQMAGQLGIEGKLQKPMKTCSYGEQQRVAIIRSLQQPFNVLLLDEPFSHLDENNRSIAMQLIDEEVKKRNAAIILADLKKIDQFVSTTTISL